MKWFSRRPFTALLVSMALAAFLPLLLNNLFYIRFRNTVLEQQKSLTEESLKFSVQQIDRTLIELTTLSMKLGEIRLIEKEMGESPALLLDDVFSELDAKRRNALFKSAAPLQTFITCTDRQDAAGAKADCFLQVTSTPEGTVLRRE